MLGHIQSHPGVRRAFGLKEKSNSSDVAAKSAARFQLIGSNPSRSLLARGATTCQADRRSSMASRCEGRLVVPVVMMAPFLSSLSLMPQPTARMAVTEATQNVGRPPHSHSKPQPALFSTA
jgi:hypothetical protein